MKKYLILAAIILLNSSVVYANDSDDFIKEVNSIRSEHNMQPITLVNARDLKDVANQVKTECFPPNYWPDTYMEIIPIVNNKFCDYYNCNNSINPENAVSIMYNNDTDKIGYFNPFFSPSVSRIAVELEECSDNYFILGKIVE